MSRDQQKCLPIICGRDRQTGSHAASFVKSKGRDAYAAAYVTNFVRRLGYKRVVFKSDNEPALLALLKVVIDNLPGVEVVPRNSPEGDHAAHGLADIGVREAKGQTRVIRSHLESKLGTRLAEDEEILTWIPRHGVNCINRYRIGEDGRTPEQRRTGRKWKRTVVDFGETVFYRPIARSGGRKEDAEARTKKGVFVGHHERTGTHLMMTLEGLARGVGIHRLPESQRRNLDFVRSCRGVPWGVRSRKKQVERSQGDCTFWPVTSKGMGPPMNVPDARRWRLEVEIRHLTTILVEQGSLS